ncbi:MAG: RidA family protein [Candidatus Promineifilaceae bacterium]
MTIQYIDLNDPGDGHTYSSATVAGDYIFTSHIGGFLDEEGKVLEGTAVQTAQCFKNLSEILLAAGASLEDVVKVTVYLKDMRDFEDMRDVYRGIFKGGFPARMTATTRFVDPRCRIQIEAIAYKG